jgi:hypothetical protein
MPLNTDLRMTRYEKAFYHLINIIGLAIYKEEETLLNVLDVQHFIT